MKLDSAVLYTNDIPAACKFYSELLGLKLLREDVDKFLLLAFENDVNLSIKKSSEPREHPGCQTVFIRCENIEETYERIKSKGVLFYNELQNES